MKHFLLRRWRGQVPLRTLLWRDMVGVGSSVNLASTVLALVLTSSSAPLGLAAAVHFAPLPYNLFLIAAVWQSPQRSVLMSFIAALRLAVVTAV